MKSFPNKQLSNLKSICQNYSSLNLKISYQMNNQMKLFTTRDVLPKKFCVLALQSIYPYLETYELGGWFNWVGYDDNLIINCVHKSGVYFGMKPVIDNSVKKYQAEILGARNGCYKKYQPQEKFMFDITDHKIIEYKILYNLIPFLNRLVEKEQYVLIYKKNIITYQVLAVEEI